MIPLPLDIVLKASALLAAAGLIEACLRRGGSAAARHLVWTLAIAGVLALPVASVAVPHWQLSIPIARASGPLALREAAAAPLTPPSENETTVVSPAPETTSASGGARPGWGSVAIGLYAIGLLLLLARLGLEPRALRRLAAASCEVTDAAWQRMLGSAAGQMGVSRSVRLLQSADDVMPLTFGLRHPTILLPASADAWSADRRRAVLLHELAHVSRGDCLTQMITAVACAVYWPHPGVWWAAHRLRVERELACDDRVLAAGTDADDYAGHLLEIARSFGRRPAPAIALSMARARQLEHRLLAVLDAARNRADLARRSRVVAAVAAFAALLPIVALRAAIVPYDDAAARELAPIQRGAASQAPAAPSAGTLDAAGTWGLRLVDGARVNLTLRTLHSSHGMTIPLAKLEGLAASEISSAAGVVHFTSRRDAGTFSFAGVCHSGLCGGTYGFEANAAFAAELARRGVGTPTADEQASLALEDVGLAYLDALKAAGYKMPDVHELVRAAQHGVSADYVQAMAALGYRLGTIEPLIRLRDHGVDPEYVRGMAANGFPRAGAEELVRARDHGVDPDYVKGLASLGFNGLALDALVGARDHGVDPDYVRGMQALGHQGSLADLTRARDHGVDPEYIRGLAALGYRELDLDGLIRMRDHGVDPAYVHGLADVGYRAVPAESLIRLRDHGVDPDYVRRLRERGVTNLTVDELIQRRDRGQDDPAAAAAAAMAGVRAAWRPVLRWWQQARA